jgi:arsenate reductase
MAVVIYHNPGCSKFLKTLRIFQDKGVSLEIVEYMQTLLDVTELKRIVGLLGVSVGDIVRAKEAAEEGVVAGLDDEGLFAAIIDHPRIMQRPIVINDDRAAIRRLPENVFDIF